jgi:hypothetical protein
MIIANNLRHAVTRWKRYYRVEDPERDLSPRTFKKMNARIEAETLRIDAEEAARAEEEEKLNPKPLEKPENNSLEMDLPSPMTMAACFEQLTVAEIRKKYKADFADVTKTSGDSSEEDDYWSDDDISITSSQHERDEERERKHSVMLENLEFGRQRRDKIMEFIMQVKAAATKSIDKDQDQVDKSRLGDSNYVSYMKKNRLWKMKCRSTVLESEITRFSPLPQEKVTVPTVSELTRKREKALARMCGKISVQKVTIRKKKIAITAAQLLRIRKMDTKKLRRKELLAQAQIKVKREKITRKVEIGFDGRTLAAVKSEKTDEITKFLLERDVQNEIPIGKNLDPDVEADINEFIKHHENLSSQERKANAFKTQWYCTPTAEWKFNLDRCIEAMYEHNFHLRLNNGFVNLTNAMVLPEVCAEDISQLERLQHTEFHTDVVEIEEENKIVEDQYAIIVKDFKPKPTVAKEVMTDDDDSVNNDSSEEQVDDHAHNKNRPSVVANVIKFRSQQEDIPPSVSLQDPQAPILIRSDSEADGTHLHKEFPGSSLFPYAFLHSGENNDNSAEIIERESCKVREATPCRRDRTNLTKPWLQHYQFASKSKRTKLTERQALLRYQQGCKCRKCLTDSLALGDITREAYDELCEIKAQTRDQGSDDNSENNNQQSEELEEEENPAPDTYDMETSEFPNFLSYLRARNYKPGQKQRYLRDSISDVDRAPTEGTSLLPSERTRKNFFRDRYAKRAQNVRLKRYMKFLRKTCYARIGIKDADLSGEKWKWDRPSKDDAFDKK